MIENLISDYVKFKKDYRTGLTLDELCDDYVPADAQKDICKLNENENMLGPSPMAVKAMQDEASRCHFYPEGSGKRLRTLLASRFGKDPLNYLITDGASVGLNLIGEVFIQPGDEVILPSLTYGAYKNIVARYGGSIKIVQNLNDGSFDLEGMQKAISQKTKMIIICNPNNPTGSVIGKKRLSAFLDTIPENIIVVIDEAYIQYFTEEGGNGMMDYISEEHCHTILVRTFSKVYGLAGARIGYVISSQEIIRALRSVANYFCANRVSLAGAAAALQDFDYEKKSIHMILSERQRLSKALTDMSFYVYPSAANFLYVDFGQAPEIVCQRMETYKIYLRGDYPCVRISIGRPEQNDILLRALKKEINQGIFQNRNHF